jgi:hypothetical protein
MSQWQIDIARKIREELRAIKDSLGLLHLDFEKHINTASEARKAEKERNEPEPVASSELKITETVKTHKIADDTASPRREWIKVGIEAATLCAVIVYACLTLREWREMISARHVAQVAIETAKRSASEALSQVQRNFIADQKPYVWITDEIGPFVQAPHSRGNTSDKLAFNYHFKNYGKSPAINCQEIGHILLGRNADKRIAFAPLDPGKGAVLPPGKESFNTAFSDQAIDPTLLADINSKGKDVYVTVAVHFQYSDTSGNVYDSEFCIQRDPFLSMVFCDTHNGIK